MDRHIGTRLFLPLSLPPSFTSFSSSRRVENPSSPASCRFIATRISLCMACPSSPKVGTRRPPNTSTHRPWTLTALERSPSSLAPTGLCFSLSLPFPFLWLIFVRSFVCVCFGLTSSGIGKEVALAIAHRGGTVYLVCRNSEKAEQARQEIITETKNEKVIVKILDLANLRDINRFVAEFKQESPKLDILVNSQTLPDSYLLSCSFFHPFFPHSFVFFFCFLFFLAGQQRRRDDQYADRDTRWH